MNVHVNFVPRGWRNVLKLNVRVKICFEGIRKECREWVGFSDEFERRRVEDD